MDAGPARPVSVDYVASLLFADVERSSMRRFSAEYLRETRRGMWEDGREALSPLELSRRNRILDVGCGEGALTRVLAEASEAAVIGCDREPDLLSELNLPAVRGDALTLPFVNSSFDLVVCQALLINLPDPVDAIEEFARVSSETVGCIEPDNAAVSIDSTVDAEATLAAKARRRYLRGVETDVSLGTDLGDLLREAGLADVRVERYDFERTVEPPYHPSSIRTVSRTASGAGLRDRRETMAGTDEELDALRSAWRSMGRDAIDQIERGEYRRREVVPFYVGVGEI